MGIALMRHQNYILLSKLTKDSKKNYTGSLQSMATVKYLENSFSEILEIW
jgi:hypothetical protein